jgi:hypothetical protein
MSRAGITSVLGKAADPRPDDPSPARPRSTWRVAFWCMFWVTFPLYQISENWIPWWRHDGPSHGLAFGPVWWALVFAFALSQARVNLSELRRRRPWARPAAELS